MSTLRRQASPSASYRGGSVGLRIGRVVDQGERRDRDRLADPVGEQRPALEHRLTVEGAGQDAEEGGGDPRLEDNGQVRRAGLAGAEQAGGPQHGVGGRLVERQVVGRPADRVAATGLGVGPLAGDGVGRDVAAGPAGAAEDPGAGGHGRFTRRVAPVRRLDLADARIAGPYQALELEGGVDLRSVGNGASSSRHRSSSAAATPSGTARPRCSSGVPKPALSRASARVSATTSSSSDPA